MKIEWDRAKGADVKLAQPGEQVHGDYYVELGEYGLTISSAVSDVCTVFEGTADELRELAAHISVAVLGIRPGGSA
jgi:hypothetical protein